MRWDNSTRSRWLVWLSLLMATLGLILALIQPTVTTQLPPTPTPTSNKPKPGAYQPLPPSLAQVFNSDHSWTATLSAEKTTTMVVTGDVLLAREVNYRTTGVKTGSEDFYWPFAKTADFLRSADITIVNLETPLIANCPPLRDRMVFCGDPRNVSGLKWSGVDIASLANNHALNQGVAGVNETEAILESAGIQSTGIKGKPAFVTHQGVTFAVIGYTDLGATAGIINQSQLETIRQDIAQLKSQADVVIPFFHWGEEYRYEPTPRQELLAHAAIDAGADLVIGNHPHWYQPLEIYQDKAIMYSHGNFVFDQMWSVETRQGIVGKYTFFEDKLIDIEFLPVLIEDYGQPSWLMDEAKQERLEHLQSISVSQTRP